MLQIQLPIKLFLIMRHGKPNLLYGTSGVTFSPNHFQKGWITMSKHTNKLISLALTLVMLCALTVPAFASDNDDWLKDWEWSVNIAPHGITVSEFLDNTNPETVVVPDSTSAVKSGAINDPNMTVISLPQSIVSVGSDNGIENCKEIIYRGSEDMWFNLQGIYRPSVGVGRPRIGNSSNFPRRIPVKTLDGTVIDYVGPATAPIAGGQDKPAEPEPTPEPVQPATTFSDVPANAWYAEAVSWAVEKGITNGTGNGNFSPDRACTQCECLVFLFRAAGSPKTDATLPFTVKNAWATDALKWAYSKGIIGTGFDENAACTRYTVVNYIWKAFGSPAADTAVKFTDIAGLDARPIAWAVENGIVNGVSTTRFSPNGSCTRGTIATLLFRAASK